MRRPLGAVAVTLAVAAGAVTGCTAARNTLGTSSSPCFRALPVAAAAVHRRGAFVGVRLVSSSELSKLNHLRRDIEARSRTTVKSICVVGYKGSFRRAQVQRPAGPVPDAGVGHFAVVVVSFPQNELLATVVLVKEPLRLRHLT